MPIGVITVSLAVAVGGLLGTLLRSKFSENLKEMLNLIFGLCAMSMGVASVVLMKNMPAVVLSIIVGTVLGLLLKLGERVRSAGALMQRCFPGGSGEDSAAELLTVIVLFCVSGTGIYGSILSGMNGDHSILISKAILDLFTAMIFACSLGPVVSLIAVPQLIINLILFFCAGLIFPLTTPEMINDFKACGGFIMIATGFRMIKVKMFPTADMIPAMVLVMPVSWLWSSFVLPLIG